MRTIKVELKNAQGDIVKGVILETEERHWKSTWSEEDTEMYINVASSLRGYACGLENEEHKKHIKKELDWLENRFKSLLSQPMQEWSEEDEKTFWGFTAYIPNEELERLGVTRDDILKKLKSLRPKPIQLKEAYKDGFQTARHAMALAFMNYLDKNRPKGKMSLSNGECEDIDKAFKECDWAKIMRYVEKYSPQPKQEWSEEDRINLNSVLNHLKEYLTNDAYTYYEKWLKSLRPQSKIHYWTEEEIEPIISDYLTGREHYGGMMSRLRCLKPKSHWKPSVEQMNTLLSVEGILRSLRHDDKAKILASIYEQLKKLM